MRSLTHMWLFAGLQPVQQYFAQKLCREQAERVSWQEAFYGFCMSLNVAFLALVYHPAAEEAFSRSKKPPLSLSGNWRTFHTSITAAKCPSDGKTLEKCRNANWVFFVNDWLKVPDINQAETGGDFWNFDPFQTTFIEINTQPGLSRAVKKRGLLLERNKWK